MTVAAFLAGVPLAIALTRAMPGLFLPAIGVLSLTGVADSA